MAKILTPRENEVLYWVAEGYTNKEIGEVLGIATETIKEHVQSILKKLDARNRAHAAAMISAEMERQACVKLAHRLDGERLHRSLKGRQALVL